MRKVKLSDLEERIREKTPLVTRALLRDRHGKLVRRRPRDKEEQVILDLLCKQKWEKDLARGKIKIINEREWYYEFD